LPGNYILLAVQYGRFFTARRYAKCGICRRRVSVRLSVCLCECVRVCLSHSGIVSKRLNVGLRKLCHTIGPGLQSISID